MKRDAKADLEMCEKATPGPWSKSRMDMDSYSCNEKGDYEIVAYVYRNPEPRIPCFGLQFRNDAKFISESREALPYWIKRAQEAEKLLKEILPAAKYLSQRYDAEDNKLSIWTVMVAKINEFVARNSVDLCE